MLHPGSGGNGYVGTLLAAGAVTSVVRLLPFLSTARREWLGDLVGFRTTPETTPEAFAAVAVSQTEIVERVRERAPQARILLIDYLTLIDMPSRGDTASLTPTQKRAAADIGRGLAEAFHTAATRSGAELIAASAASVAHGVGRPTRGCTASRSVSRAVVARCPTTRTWPG